MAAGRATAGTDALRLDAPVRGVVAYIAHSTLGVLDRGGILETWRLTVVNRENGIAVVDHGFDVGQAQRCLFQSLSAVGQGRVPAGPVDINDAVAVLRFGLVDVHEQTEAGDH